jgi:pimeloyl-ACP methyl ester carboxylesterase
MSLFLVAFVAVGIGLWLVSFAVEALRPAPKPREALSWAPEIPIGYVDVDACKLRYIKAGRGPNVVLLHTLRTQLDLFQKVVPILAQRFTVHAVDYPGHGFSDIPKGRYDADFFARFIERFLDDLDLRDVTLCGVSIGGALALILAGRHNARGASLVAINPYD